MGVKTKSNYKPDGRDVFQTPRYATELILPFLPSPDPNLVIWECAAGDGAITKVLREYGYEVLDSDLRPEADSNWQHNFLLDPSPFESKTRQVIVVTNPPFSRKRQFYQRCLQLQLPFALLIPADYTGWMIDAVRNVGCTKVVPTRRIDYITPSGKDASIGATADFHSLWLTRGFIYRDVTEIFVDLSLEEKKRIY